MRTDLRERLEFLADELVREEAVGLVVVSAQLVMEMDDWSQPVRVRFVERDDAPGLFELEVRTADAIGVTPAGGDTGYELDDPKHPAYVERIADWADLERKRRREER